MENNVTEASGTESRVRLEVVLDANEMSAADLADMLEVAAADARKHADQSPDMMAIVCLDYSGGVS